jgi:hypothetical protein
MDLESEVNMPAKNAFGRTVTRARQTGHPCKISLSLPARGLLI